MKVFWGRFFLSAAVALAATSATQAAETTVSVSDRASFDAAILKASLARDGSTIVVTDDPAPLGAESGPAMDLLNAFSSPIERWREARGHAYPNADIYILWGDLDDSWTESEYDQFYHVTKWLVKHGFRSLINPVAYEKDVREAVASPTTSGILWSSHGDTEGNIFDSGENAMKPDTFFTNAGANFRQLVLSSCYGEAAEKNYKLNERTKLHHWTGTTTTPEYFAYLDGQWQKDLETDLLIKLSDVKVPNDKP